VTDQQHGRENGTGDDSARGQGKTPDRGSGDQTVVFPSVAWPSAEPDATPQHDPAHIDYLDTPAGPVQAPPHGVFAAGRPSSPPAAGRTPSSSTGSVATGSTPPGPVPVPPGTAATGDSTPARSGGPARPADPTESGGPARPTDPTESGGPARPTDPVESGGPAEPGDLFTPAVAAADPPGGLFAPAREPRSTDAGDGPTAELKAPPSAPSAPSMPPAAPTFPPAPVRTEQPAAARNGGPGGQGGPGQRSGAGDERTSTIGDRTARRTEQTARSNDETNVIGDRAALRAALDGAAPPPSQSGANQGTAPQASRNPANQGAAPAHNGLAAPGPAAERTGLIDRSAEQTGLMGGPGGMSGPGMGGRGPNEHTGLIGHGQGDRPGLLGFGQDDRTGLITHGQNDRTGLAGYAADESHDQRAAGRGTGWRSRLPSASSPAVRRGLFVAAGVLGLMVLVYGFDLLMAGGEVPRGVLVAGVDVGGMGKADAEQRLRDEIGSRLDAPVSVRAGDVEASVDPGDAGLALDWPATLAQAGDQPLNPWTRLTSLFGNHEVGIVSETDDAKLTAAVEGLRATVDHEPTEGSIHFEGTTPVGVDPKQGQTLDVPGAVDALTSNWAGGGTVELPVDTTPVRSTPESVRAALDGIAAPAVAGPVTITGEGADATITPELVAATMTFEVGADGSLSPLIDIAKLTEALKPQLAETEKEGKDATVTIQGGAPVVTPSVDGRGVDWAKSLTELPNVLRSKDNRTLPAVYGEQPAKFTTDQANALGIKEVVAEFSTRGFASDSGVNIRQIAAEVNGATVKPGETFSLNTHTGPRGTAQGYVEAGIIDKGRPGRAVGGGASQFATTLFNATYFAGMTDVAHKEHSYFISRYPEAREATVFEGVIDLVFKNDSPSGILIETVWTPSSITVRIWSTKHYEVESVTGGRSNPTSPSTVVIPHGEKCSPGPGAGGFTVSNTRIVRDARTKAEIKRNSRTAVYNPVPKVECAPAPATTPPPGG
jgi:vancomycin resistance protein YoaR